MKAISIPNTMPSCLLEGHAVAFVIGNGIGVLLRMVWVMCIVTYHIIRGERDKDAQYTALDRRIGHSSSLIEDLCHSRKANLPSSA
jgi:hypothetical protein